MYPEVSFQTCSLCLVILAELSHLIMQVIHSIKGTKDIPRSLL